MARALRTGASNFTTVGDVRHHFKTAPLFGAVRARHLQFTFQPLSEIFRRTSILDISEACAEA
jgi:hypothetical protein